MATFTFDVSDRMIAEVQAAHARRQARLPLEQRTELLVDDKYARMLVVASLRNILQQEIVARNQSKAEAEVEELQGEVDAWESGPP